LTDVDAAIVWRRYIQLTAVEWAFWITKNKLSICPIWHHAAIGPKEVARDLTSESPRKRQARIATGKRFVASTARSLKSTCPVASMQQPAIRSLSSSKHRSRNNGRFSDVG